STKPVTAVLLGQFLEAGKMAWDDPVARFIPEFAAGGKEGVTIRQLLQHTGGFRPADRIAENLSWDETLQRICETPIEAGWVPGEQAGYHMYSSWLVLGEVVQRLSGQPFSTYVRNQIFEPLGMKDSWIGMPPASFQEYGNRIGWMHSTERNQIIAKEEWNSEDGCGRCRPGSNGRGPIRELGWFYEFLLGLRQPTGSFIISVDTIGEVTRRSRVGLFDRTFQHQIDWGLGFIVNSQRYGSETVPYGFGLHASDDTFGHSGAQSSCAFADPKHRLVVAWVCNGMPGPARHHRRARDLNTAIYQDLGLIEG
ncbi:MAG: beta-lactamase family protein, partial [Opitutaceae bacterium]|nr:beta-lactamase family protein [Verrucomicrobiales bacterium]